MYISGTKFEERCSNVSVDILNSVFMVLVELFMTSSLFSFAYYKNVNISKTKKDFPKRRTPFFFTLKNLSNKPQLFFTS